MSIICLHHMRGLWTPGEEGDHAAALATFFAVHTAHQVRRRTGGWAWSESAVAECLEATWNMTGRWKARRVVTMRRADFDRRVAEIVPGIAGRLNRSGVTCLRDLASASESSRRRTVMALHNGVREISALRKTAQIEPVLGSKVLHHFFPSLVPVYDRQYVQKGVTRLPEFGAFRDSYPERWIEHRNAGEAGGVTMLGYHEYFAFCMAQVSQTPRKELTSVRRAFGKGFADLAPWRLVRHRDGLLWRMDAKLVEYCLVGRASQLGLL